MYDSMLRHRFLPVLCLLLVQSVSVFGQVENGGPAEQGNEVTLTDEVRGLWGDGDATLEEKVKVFRSLTEARWIAFAGFVHVYAGRSYLDVFHWHKEQYGEAMAALDSDTDVSGLLALARDKMGVDALVSADAIMLAAILNWEQAEPALVELSEPNVARDALVRPIHVHTLCLIAAAKQSEAMMDRLQPILRLSKHEEMRQDILCAVSSLDSIKSAGWVKGFVESNLTGEYELDMHTALLILSKRMPTEKFESYMTGLIEAAEDEATVALLTLYRDDAPAHGGAEPPPNGVDWYYKLWDGFQSSGGDGRVRMRYGDVFDYEVVD